MKTMKVMILTMSLWGSAALARVNEYTYTFINNTVIPDANVLGLTLATNLSGMGGTISDVTVNLNISGGFNGDYFGYLRGPSGGFAVLLNRVGASNSASQFGYSDGGLDVNFLDAASHSIQYYQNDSPGYSGEQLIGSWQPEGVTVDPLTNDPAAFFGAPQNALLGSFANSNPNGVWTLFLADVAGGNQGTMVSWGLNIKTIPEPGTLALAELGLTAVFLVVRRRQP
jgi:subtilisin-like proprotein convertase family protein